MDERMKDITRAEWRELGFFYDRDDNAREWLIVGSRAGLRRFAARLRTYAASPKGAVASEHEHYGPYMYLEVMTWPEAGMDDHAIYGPAEELDRLASLVELRLAGLQPGNAARIREEFTPKSPYALVLALREDSFDPASADSSLGNTAEDDERQYWPDMPTQHRQIEEMLERAGWRVAERHVGPEWWLDEVWVLKSVWSPVGTRAFVSFLVHPMVPAPRAKGEGVWAVCVSTEGPAVTPMGVNSVPLRPNWEASRREKVLEQIRSLRAG
jgi:hypothetical protein